MSNEINPQNPFQGVAPPKTNWRAIWLTIVSALLLGAGSCFGAIVSSGSILSSIFSFLFIVCVLAFVGGLLWALGMGIERITPGK